MIAEFLASFVLLFVAELGDKTQFITMSLASRLSAKAVAAGVLLASFALTTIAVVFGTALSSIAGQSIIVEIGAGLLFLAFGIASFVSTGDDDDGEIIRAAPGPGAVWMVFAAFFVAELGDKTQIATFTRASTSEYPLAVLVGATMGFAMSNLLGLVVGRAAAARLSARQLRALSGTIFILFGLSYLWQALAPRAVELIQ